MSFAEGYCEGGLWINNLQNDFESSLSQSCDNRVTRVDKGEKWCSGFLRDGAYAVAVIR